MNRFIRCVFWFFVGVAIAGFAEFSYAGTYNAFYYIKSPDNKSYFFQNGTSASSACTGSLSAAQAWFKSPPAGYQNSYTVTSAQLATATTCSYSGTPYVLQIVPYCATGLSLSGSVCTGTPSCPAGQTPDPGSGICKVDCGTYKGQTYVGFSTHIEDFPNISCLNSCEVVMDSAKPGWDGSVTSGSGSVGVVYVGFFGHYHYTGSPGNCQGNSPSNPPPSVPLGQQGTCPDGQVVQGTINGKVYCGAPTSDKPYQSKDNSTTTSTDSSGNTTTTTSSTTTSCNGSDCSTSTSSTSSSSSSTTTTTTGATQQQSQDSYCQQNPNAPVCKNDFCKDNPNVLACQTASSGASTDDIYEKKGKTFSDVLGNFKNSVMNSQLGSAFTGYLNVSAMSGSCPDMTLNMPGFGVSSTLLNDIFCGSMFYNILQGCGTVILALASFVAFKWAVL